MNRAELKVKSEHHSSRLDLFLAEQLPDLSRRKLREIVTVGGCYLNRKRTKRNSKTVQPGDKIQIYWLDGEVEKLRNSAPVLTEDHILYEDYELIAVDKPAFVSSQATKTQDQRHMLAAVQDLLNRRRRSPIVHLVHRLDKPTTGVMLFAKSKASLKKLSDLFVEQKIAKTYLCLTGPVPAGQLQWSCDQAIGKIDPARGRVHLDRNGKSALTHFKVLQTTEFGSLIEATPATGRTHQIRVHLEASNLPLLGDKHYSGQRLPRDCQHQSFFLHASRIEFPYWKTKKNLIVESALPAVYSQVLDQGYC